MFKKKENADGFQAIRVMAELHAELTAANDAIAAGFKRRDEIIAAAKENFKAAMGQIKTDFGGSSSDLTDVENPSFAVWGGKGEKGFTINAVSMDTVDGETGRKELALVDKTGKQVPIFKLSLSDSNGLLKLIKLIYDSCYAVVDQPAPTKKAKAPKAKAKK